MPIFGEIRGIFRERWVDGYGATISNDCETTRASPGGKGTTFQVIGVRCSHHHDARAPSRGAGLRTGTGPRQGRGDSWQDGLPLPIVPPLPRLNPQTNPNRWQTRTGESPRSRWDEDRSKCPQRRALQDTPHFSFRLGAAFFADLKAGFRSPLFTSISRVRFRQSRFAGFSVSGDWGTT